MVSGGFPLKTNPSIDAWASIELEPHAGFGGSQLCSEPCAKRCATNDPIAMELTAVATPASNKSEKMEDTKVCYQD